MIYSMTGFGNAEIQQEENRIVVELKTVNNRYLEISCRMPSSLSQYEQKIREIVRNHIQRGKLYLNISIQGINNGHLAIQVEKKTARSIRILLEDLQEATGVEEPLKLEHFLKFSEIFETNQDNELNDLIWQKVQEALKQALQNLKSMRAEEGKALVADLKSRIKKINLHVEEIERLSKNKASEAYERLLVKVKQLVQDSSIVVDRIESEVALMAEKMDVTEECVRLRSHNDLFLNILENENVVGKKLNFLLQEMNREANTISSKASYADISHIVVDMKEEIEKLREQVQNLE